VFFKQHGGAELIVSLDCACSHGRMGIFDAAALAWLFFHSINGGRPAA
jgi:hypothetical protein